MNTINKKCHGKGRVTAAILAAFPLLLTAAAVHAQPAVEGAALGGAAAGNLNRQVVRSVPAANAKGSAATRPLTARPAPANAAKSAQALQGLTCSRGIIQQQDPVALPIGKSTLLRLPNPVTYRTVGSASIAQAVLVPPDGLYLLGVHPGSTNMIIQDKSEACHVVDVIVQVDTQALTQSFKTLMPNEKDLYVTSTANSIVLSGMVEDASAVQRAVEIANAHFGRSGSQPTMSGAGAAPDGAMSGQSRVINQLSVRAPQQVMLEVKVAEVSKTLLDRLGSSVGVNRSSNGGSDSFSLISNFLTNGGGLVQAMRIGSTALSIDGQKDDGLVRVLAEPNIMAISGQQASFLSGGKIFIPVAQDNSATGAGSRITLEEKEFGIGVKFLPTLVSGTRINLKLVSEVSDLTQTGSPFTTINGVTSVLPSLTVRRADTTVQLNDGQSFVIAGLIKNNFTETVKRFPGLGETPILGTLFRSTEFQNDQTELMFVITPRLVKPLPDTARLPTDNHVIPTRAEVYSNGSLESLLPAASAPSPGTM